MGGYRSGHGRSGGMVSTRGLQNLQGAMQRVQNFAPEPVPRTVKSVSPMHEGMETAAIRVDFTDGLSFLWERSGGLKVTEGRNSRLATPYQNDIFRDAVRKAAETDERTKAFVEQFPDVLR